MAVVTLVPLQQWRLKLRNSPLLHVHIRSQYEGGSAFVWWCGPWTNFHSYQNRNKRSPEAVVTAITENICKSLWILGNMTLAIDCKTVFRSLLAVNLSTDDVRILFQLWYSALKFFRFSQIIRVKLEQIRKIWISAALAVSDGSLDSFFMMGE